MSMIKNLFFAVTLLMPALAYGASGSANLTILVVPASGAGVPGPAAAAGFTTQALNADFTSPAYSNKATFINECGATATLRFYWSRFLSTTGLSCNDIAVVSDGGSLPQVFTISYPPSEWMTGGDTGAANLNYPGYAYQPGIPCAVWPAGCFPIEFYIESVFRTSEASWHQPGTIGHMYLDTIGRNIKPDHTYPANNWFEWIAWETTQPPDPNFGAGMADAFNFGPVTFWNMDATQYHKVGVLVTSDESTNIWKCTWVDDAFQVCQGFPQPGAQVTNYTQHDNDISIGFGTFNNVAPTVPIQLWFQYIKIWTCSGYQTGGCAGPMVDHWPYP